MCFPVKLQVMIDMSMWGYCTLDNVVNVTEELNFSFILFRLI